MPSMRAAIFVEPGRIVLGEKPIPDVGPLDALLRITTTTICGTDVHILKGEYPVAKGLTIGHEPVGIIEKLGSAVQGYREGQRVIAGAITPSGHSAACLCGCGSQDGGFGKSGFKAMGGWRYIVGEPDRPPSRMGISIGDTLTATYGCMGVLAALHARASTGKGQVIDTALYEAVLQVMESVIPEYDHSGIIRERSGSFLPGIAPSNVYKCSDGDFMIGANKDAIFGRLAEAMGRPELATDPRYATHVARGTNQIELDALINTWTSTLTIDEVDALMIKHSIPAGKVYRAPEMLADPHFQAREAIIEVETERFGKLKMQNVVPRLSATPSSVRTPAPSIVGQHNAEIYGGLLGMAEAQLSELAARGII